MIKGINLAAAAIVIVIASIGLTFYSQPTGAAQGPLPTIGLPTLCEEDGNCVDTIPPVLVISYPLDQQNVFGIVVVAADVSDNDRILNVRFFVDDVPTQIDFNPPYTFTWNTSEISDGNHSLKAVARDAAGNIGSNTINVVVSSTPPNVIFILLDDVGYADLGTYGGTYIQTPNMDNFATQGMKATQYYTHPVCCPSRVSFLSGHYPLEFGVTDIYAGDSLRGIPTDVNILADMFKSAGYTTGHIGKWHVGANLPKYLPNAQGFDYSAIRYPLDTDTYFDPTYLVNDSQLTEYPGHATEISTDLAIDFINNNANNPFYLNVWYNAGHIPLEPPADWEALYPDTTAGKYAALVSDADEQILRILNTLDSLGLSNNTLIIITSDNGAVETRHPGTNSNGILHGQKDEVYEGGIRTLMLARWPGHIPANTTNDSVINVFDFFPTFASLINADTTNFNLKGENVLNVFLNNETLTRTNPLFWEHQEGRFYFDAPSGYFDQFAVRKGDWKLVKDNFPEGIDSIPKLYNIANDISETTDLAESNPSKVNELITDYLSWRQVTGKIQYEVESISGNASFVSPNFNFINGIVILKNNDRFDIDDGDFSFQTKVTINNTNNIKQMIAEKNNSWSLFIDANKFVNLKVYDTNMMDSATLKSTSALNPNTEYDIAFTEYNFKISPNLIRLYVNGQKNAEVSDTGRVNVTSFPVTMGNDLNSSSPLNGSIRDPKFYVMHLTPNEIQQASSNLIKKQTKKFA
ncbi:MAG: sulfatase-like hydrolase/transferase [archaeon]|nr:sulfatase-like hydrolase/transferase [archaeon]